MFCIFYYFVVTNKLHLLQSKFLIYKPLEVHKDKFKSKIIISGGLIAFFMSILST